MPRCCPCWSTATWILPACDSALLDTGKLAGIALFCVGTASAFGWLLAYYKIPEAILSGVTAWGMAICGDGVLRRCGYFRRRLLPRCDPRHHHSRAKSSSRWPRRWRWIHVHFATIGIVSLAFGLATPPYGPMPDDCLLGGRHPHPRCHQGYRGSCWCRCRMVLALVIVWPELSLWLPGLLSPEFLRWLEARPRQRPRWPLPADTARTARIERGLRRLAGRLQARDVELDHLQHGFHHALWISVWSLSCISSLNTLGTTCQDTAELILLQPARLRLPAGASFSRRNNRSPPASRNRSPARSPPRI